MPFKIVTDHPSCKAGYAVVTEATSKLHGCFASMDAAKAQLRALYANVPEASK